MKVQPKIDIDLVHKAALEVVEHYSPYWQRNQRPRLRQFAEEISLIYKPGGKVVDLGGGDWMRCAICTHLGMTAHTVDFYELNFDLNDHMGGGFREEYFKASQVAQSLGVVSHRSDVLSWRTDMKDIDVMMSFDTLEHLHHSPRELFKHIKGRMAPGGEFLIGVPNAANLVKRLRVLAGKNAFSRMQDYYYTPLFTGHVREPVVADLYEIARDLAMQGTVVGANWLGFSRLGPDSKIARLADFLLRPFPTLCSDIYLYARNA